MKLKIEVDIDWIEEDGSIDEEVKHSIIQGVKSSISEECLKKVEAKASQEIDKAIDASIKSAQKMIEEKALSFATNWLNEQVVVTDKWGDGKEARSIRDIIKSSFDNLLEKKVDKSGSFSSYGDMKLIKYLTGEMVEEIVAGKLRGFGTDIDSKIKDAVNSGIKEKVANKFAELIVK